MTQENLQPAQDLLTALHGDYKNSIIRRNLFYYCKKDNKIKECYETISWDSIQYYNITHESDIYFVVNQGGTKGTQINDFTAVFVDLDYGKDEEERYFMDMTNIEKFKEEKYNEVMNWDLPPSNVNHTRNGIQVFWFIENTTPDRWKQVQMKLIQVFGGDPKVKNYSRVMRLPGTIWKKKQKSVEYDPYLTSVRFLDPSIKYSIEEFETILQDVVLPVKSVTYHTRKNTNTIHGVVDSTMVDAIINRDIEYLHSVLQIDDPVLVETYQEYHDYITQNIDLASFLGIPNKHSCLFHADSTPSADIFLSNKHQHMYHCNSSSCGVSGNIRLVVKSLLDCTWTEADDFLQEVFQIVVKSSEWQKQQHENIEALKRFIIHDLEESYPDTFELIKKDIPLIILMMTIAQDNLYSEEFAVDGKPVFFSSIRYISGLLGNKDHKNVSKKLSKLSFLKIIQKLQENDIPKRLLEGSLRHDNKRMISYYTFGDYDLSMLKEMRQRTNMLDDKVVSKHLWTYEGIYRTFTPELASELFPSKKDYQLSRNSNEMVNLIHEYSTEMIQSRGWATEKEILDLLEVNYKKTISQHVFKKSINEMLDSYSFIRVRLNKKIKEELNIQSMSLGSFIIIGKES